MDYAGIAQKEKLTELQLRVRQLLAQVDQINKEQNYQRVSYYHPQRVVEDAAESLNNLVTEALSVSIAL